MTNCSIINKPPRFLFTILTSLIAGLLVAGIVMAWTNPTANPPSGGGALYYYNGNVGIGTTSPGAKLEVAGNIRATGGTPIYSCPNNVASSCTGSCVGGLSLSATCTYSSTNLPCTWTTANCTLVGRLVEP